MSDDDSRPATKGDLRDAIAQIENFILEREIRLVWKFVLFGVALFGAQTIAITWMMSHWKP
jgi:hypothetical protein